MNNDISQNQQTIPILDFGAQYVQLIARRVREAGVYAVLVRPDISVEELRKLNPVGIILSGGGPARRCMRRGALEVRSEVVRHQWGAHPWGFAMGCRLRRNCWAGM